MELTPAALDYLFKQFQTDYARGYKARTQFWPRYAERVPSSTETNTYGWLAELPGFREWVGPRIMRNIASRVYALTNKDWEDSFTVSRNKIADDQYGIYSRNSELLGDAGGRLWDDLTTDALIAGTTALCHDGQYFFDTDHPVDQDDAGAGTYANAFTAKPLNAANLADLRSTMMAFKGESGKPLEVNATLLMVPPQLAVAAFEAAKSNLYAAPVRNVAATENVAAAAVDNPQRGAWGDMEVLVNPRLAAAPTVYYVLSTDRIRPIILQVRKEPELVARLDASMDNVFHRKEFEFGADARGVAGYTLPFLAIRAVTV